MIWSGAVSKDVIMSEVCDANYLINCIQNYNYCLGVAELPRWSK